MTRFFSACQYARFLVAFLCMGCAFDAHAGKTLEQAQAALESMIKWPNKVAVPIIITEATNQNIELFKRAPPGLQTTLTITVDQETTEAEARQLVTDLLTHGALSPDNACTSLRNADVSDMTTKFMRLTAGPATGLEIAVYGSQEKLGDLLANAELQALLDVTYSAEAGHPHILTLKPGIPFSLPNKLILLGQLLIKTTDDFVVAITTLPGFDAKRFVQRTLGTDPLGFPDAPAPIAAAPAAQPDMMDEMTYQKELVTLAGLLGDYGPDDLTFIIEGADQVTRARLSIVTNLSAHLRHSLITEHIDNQLTLKFKPRTMGLIKRKILLVLLEQKLIQPAQLPEILRQKMHDIKVAYAFRGGYDAEKRQAVAWLVATEKDDEETKKFKLKYANPPRIKKTAATLGSIIGVLTPAVDPAFAENGEVLTLPSVPPFPFAHLEAAKRACEDTVHIATTHPSDDILVPLLAAVKATRLNTKEDTRKTAISTFPQGAHGIQNFLHYVHSMRTTQIFPMVDEMPLERADLISWAHTVTEHGINYARVLDPLANFIINPFDAKLQKISETEKWDITQIQLYQNKRLDMRTAGQKTKGIHAALWSGLIMDWSVEYLGAEVVGLLRRFNQSETAEEAREYSLMASTVATYNSQHAHNQQHLTDRLNADEDYKKSVTFEGWKDNFTRVMRAIATADPDFPDTYI